MLGALHASCCCCSEVARIGDERLLASMQQDPLPFLAAAEFDFDF